LRARARLARRDLRQVVPDGLSTQLLCRWASQISALRTRERFITLIFRWPAAAIAVTVMMSPIFTKGLAIRRFMEYGGIVLPQNLSRDVVFYSSVAVVLIATLPVWFDKSLRHFRADRIIGAWVTGTVLLSITAAIGYRNSSIAIAIGLCLGLTILGIVALFAMVTILSRYRLRRAFPDVALVRELLVAQIHVTRDLKYWCNALFRRGIAGHLESSARLFGALARQSRIGDVALDLWMRQRCY